MTIAILAGVGGVILLLALAGWYLLRQTRKNVRLKIETEQLRKLREVERVARENWNDIDSSMPSRRFAARERVLQEVGRIVSASASISDTGDKSR